LILFTNYSTSTAARASAIAIVEIGAEKTRFHIHRPLLEKYSEYFKAALNGPWREAEEGVVKLDDVGCGTCEPKLCQDNMPIVSLISVVEIFVDWLYTQTLPNSSPKWAVHSTANLSTEFPRAQLAVAEAYVLGDRIIARVFQKAVYRHLVFKLVNRNHDLWFDAIVLAFNNLPSEDPILTLFVHAHCRSYQTRCDTKLNGELGRRVSLPHDFLLRVMLRYNDILGKRLERQLKPCDYHNHRSKKLRESCGEQNVLNEDFESDESEQEEDDEENEDNHTAS
jgi:hypothetical protein